MSKDPYVKGFQFNPYLKKRDITGELVVVLQGTLDSRGLELIIPNSRALLQGEIHELILTDEMEAGPGKNVNRIGYIGFFEVSRGGVMVVGDEFYVGDRLLGTVAGFDETHLPNHLNLVIKVPQRATGAELHLEPGIQVTVRQRPDKEA